MNAPAHVISVPQVCIPQDCQPGSPSQLFCSSLQLFLRAMTVFAPVQQLSDSDEERPQAKAASAKKAVKAKAKPSPKIMKKPSAAVASSEPSEPAEPSESEPATAVPKRKSVLRKAKTQKADGNEETPEEVTADETTKLAEKPNAKKADFFQCFQ